jgi:hypothetical protein
MLNVWCGKEAGKARNRDISIPDAPILPTERWALFSHGALTKKITGQLDARNTITHRKYQLTTKPS